MQVVIRKFKEMADEKRDEMERVERRDIFSKAVRAGKRTYFFDVKATRKDEYYLTITESKKKFTPEGKPFYEKHKIFLYKEDFDKFSDGFQEVIDFLRENQGEIKTESESFEQTSEESSTIDLSFEDLGKDDKTEA